MATPVDAGAIHPIRIADFHADRDEGRILPRNALALGQYFIKEPSGLIENIRCIEAKMRNGPCNALAGV